MIGLLSTKTVEKMAILTEKKELFKVPEHLDVDKIKQMDSVRFADRTSEHLKNGLVEVRVPIKLQPVAQNSTNNSRKRLTKQERKQTYSQLMNIIGSNARR